MVFNNGGFWYLNPLTKKKDFVDLPNLDALLSKGLESLPTGKERVTIPWPKSNPVESTSNQIQTNTPVVQNSEEVIEQKSETKESVVVQNITYNISDSAISGGFNQTNEWTNNK